MARAPPPPPVEEVMRAPTPPPMDDGMAQSIYDEIEENAIRDLLGDVIRESKIEVRGA